MDGRRLTSTPIRLNYTGLGQLGEDLHQSLTNSSLTPGRMSNQDSTSIDKLELGELLRRQEEHIRIVARCEEDLEKTTPIAKKFEHRDEMTMTEEEQALWNKTRPVYNNAKTCLQRSSIILREIERALTKHPAPETPSTSKDAHKIPVPRRVTVLPSYTLPLSGSKKTGSTHSSVASRARSVELDAKGKILDLNKEFEKARTKLQYELEDIGKVLTRTTDELVAAELRNEQEDLQTKLTRLVNDHVREVQHIKDMEMLEKEKILNEIAGDQALDSDDDDIVNAAVVADENQNSKHVSINIPEYQQQLPLSERFALEDRSIVPVSQNQHEERADAYQRQRRGHQHAFSGSRRQEYTPAPQVPADKDAVLVQLMQTQLTLMQNPELTREWKPKDLPTFYGKPEDWAIFRNEFERTTPAGKENSSQNAIRLRKALKGTAKEAVVGLLHDPSNCTIIMKMLEERYGRNELVIKSLIKKVESTKSPDPEKMDTFVQFGTTVLQLVETVRSLKEDRFLNDSSLLDKLVNKLPGMFSRDWIMWTLDHGKTKNLATFGDWIQRQISIMVQLSEPVYKEESSGDSRGKRGLAKVTAAASDVQENSSSKDPCAYCDKPNHGITRCFMFKKASIEERTKVVKEKGLCFRCLGSGHSYRDCPSSSVCGKKDYNGRHHTLIHVDGKPWKNNRPSEKSSDSSSQKDGSFDGDSKQANIGATHTNSSKPLSIVRVRVKGPRGIRKVFALLDSGSDSTVIDKKLAAELGISGPILNHTCRGIGGIQVQSSEMSVDFEIAGNYQRAPFYKVQKGITMENMGLAPYTQDAGAVKKRWGYLRRAKLESFQDARPQLLIGEDNPHLTAHRDILERNVDEPMAKRTALGWVLAGRKVTDAGGANINALQLEDNARLDLILKESFSLDSYGVNPPAKKGSIEDQRALDILQNTVKRVGDQWECGLLWRLEDVKFPDSTPDALARMISNERKMLIDPTFSEMYHVKIEEYLEKGYISELSKEEAAVQNDRTLYIPHFGVFNVNKPGKLRLVFDAACRDSGVSLNHYLLVGPDLIRPLPSVLMNFRRHNVVINGDIEDMFHRVALRQEDRDTQRFLFRDLRMGGKSSPIKTYRMNVLIFGACSSPSSAIYVKNRNAEDYADQFPEAVRAIKEDFYCDDCLSGGKTVDEAVELRRQISQINAKGNFNVKKWLSNSREVLASIPEEDRAAGVKNFASKDVIPSERILGLWWKPEEDCFTFTANFKKVDPTLLEGRRPTKRELSRLVSSVFDPLGFIANFKVKGLILLQRVWRSGIDWDDEVTDSVYEDWKTWVENLKMTVNVKVPRLYCYDLHLAKSIQLHIFVDASEEACSSICFMRVSDGESTSVSFVCGKTKVSPNSKQTIPRLELLAAVMGANMADTVTNELNVTINGRFFWSDSRTVLTWIRTETLRYKKFVATRISRIHQLSSTSEWRWVPTALNVADDGTRFQKITELSPDSRWLRGPDFLKEEPDRWPEEKKIPVDETQLELRSKFYAAASGDSLGISISTDEMCGLSGGGNAAVVEIERFSSYPRMVRAQAAVIAAVSHWKLRFRKEKCESSPWEFREGQVPKYTAGEERSGYMRRVKMFLRKNLISNITPLQLAKAKLHLAHKVQCEAFPDEMKDMERGKLSKSSRLWKLSPFIGDGIIRLGSRLAEARVSQEIKYPIILPSRHHFTELLILYEHQVNGHQGQGTVHNNLRLQWWILDGRATVRRVIEGCMVCKLGKVKPIIPKMGSLPYCRLAAGYPPFTFTGADLFGPIEVVVGRHREKRWVCVFTCMVTRAIHLEVVYGLSTDETMMALSRFVDQRGRPRHVYTDNGTNFVGANKELKLNWESVDYATIKQCGKFHEIEWHFTPPYSPHFGGAWERMVQSVKKVLRSLLHEKHPKDQTLLTMLKGAENIVNSRPLSYVSSDPTDPESLTPNHFLRGFSDVGPNVPGTYEEADEILRVQWRKSQFFMEQFWKRWTKEVLPELARRQKWHHPTEALAVGDLVFLVEENEPRNVWSRGIITATFPGKDGEVRVVEVITVDKERKKLKTYKRGVDKVCPLGLRMGDRSPT